VTKNARPNLAEDPKPAVGTQSYRPRVTASDYFDATDVDNGWPVGLSATTRNFTLSV
jgi:hypothetical protein